MQRQRQQNTEDEQQVAIFRRAEALRREAMERESAARAAEELGIPQEFLDRAAEQLQAEQREQARAKKQWQQTLTELKIAAVPLVVALVVAVVFLSLRR